MLPSGNSAQCCRIVDGLSDQPPALSLEARLTSAAESIGHDRADEDESPSAGERTGPRQPRHLHARARQENFPVASRLLPPRYRHHLLALYAFARMVDEIGDSADGNRLSQLDEVLDDVDEIFSGSVPDVPVYRDLARTIRSCGLSQDLFERLIEANRQDQVKHRYSTFEELLDYCSFSADPVGRLVLSVFEVTGERCHLLSDRICSALQILEHCQDVSEDARAGRIYLPAEDLERFQVTEHDLLASRADRSTRALLGFQVQRAVGMLDEGKRLVASVSGTARIAIAGYVAGGYATARALADSGFDVFTTVPRPNRRRTAFELAILLASGGGR